MRVNMTMGRSRFAMILLLGVVLLTLVSLTAGSGPWFALDARTGQPVEALQVSISASDSLFEPFLAPFHIVQFSPDYRSGVIAMILWSLLIVCLGTLIPAWRKGSAASAVRRCIRNTAILLLVIIGYALFAFSNQLPNWAFQKQSGTAILADLHSHSLLSHDGLISSDANLRLHRQRGFDLVAFTDHVDPAKTTDIRLRAGEGNPSAAALPGIEIPAYFGSNCYFLVIGNDLQMPLPAGVALYSGHQLPLVPPGVYEWRPTMWSLERFVRTVHHHHGIIIAIAYQILPDDVRLLADAGIDAFELVNYGHKPLAQDVRTALLQAQRDHKIALLASNDWHGWTGALNTGTLITRPADHPDQSENQSANPPASQSANERLIAALRDHDVDHIVPVSMLPVGPMQWQQVALAPLIASWHYARSLSLWQLLSWWGWVILLLIAGRQGKQQSILQHAWPYGLMIAGGIELYQGITMLFLSSRPFSEHPGLYTGAGSVVTITGFVLLAIGLYRLKQQGMRRRDPATEVPS